MASYYHHSGPQLPSQSLPSLRQIHDRVQEHATAHPGPQCGYRRAADPEEESLHAIASYFCPEA